MPSVGLQEMLLCRRILFICFVSYPARRSGRGVQFGFVTLALERMFVYDSTACIA